MYLKSWRKPGRKLVAVVQTPAAWDVAKRIGSDLLIYDAHDDWKVIPPNRREMIESIERDAAENSDLVLASSVVLERYMTGFGCNPVPVPNACVMENWRLEEAGSEPEDVCDLPRPRVTFFGGIDESFDLAAMRCAIENVKGASWIIIGDGSRLEEAKRILSASNCRFLGVKKYEELRHYAAHSDVFLLPYTKTERNDGRDTVKLYEYLATGKPVACNNIAQTGRFPEVLCINEDGTPEGFAKACSVAMECTGQAVEKQRLEVACQHTWKERIKVLSDSVERILSARV
ncbi:MAG: glycosyltransferase [Planctomycetes bacterium]|nr:glycosyltransferase [Planctomycetota bacterium]